MHKLRLEHMKIQSPHSLPNIIIIFKNIGLQRDNTGEREEKKRENSSLEWEAKAGEQKKRMTTARKKRRKEKKDGGWKCGGRVWKKEIKDRWRRGRMEGEQQVGWLESRGKATAKKKKIANL